MKPITLEWVAKAEGDFAIVEREMRARTHAAEQAQEARQ